MAEGINLKWVNDQASVRLGLVATEDKRRVFVCDTQQIDEGRSLDEIKVSARLLRDKHLQPFVNAGKGRTVDEVYARRRLVAVPQKGQKKVYVLFDDDSEIFCNASGLPKALRQPLRTGGVPQHDIMPNRQPSNPSDPPAGKLRLPRTGGVPQDNPMPKRNPSDPSDQRAGIQSEHNVRLGNCQSLQNLVECPFPGSQVSLIRWKFPKLVC